VRPVEPGSTILADGRAIDVQSGDTLSAALIRAGILATRVTRGGRPRGFYCGMGLCNECVVEVDGVSSVRACVTPAMDRMSVKTNT
jgi:predicted molibdopterin-dependent oxidoreductase YjgC